jgi:hypothetical protein
LVGEEGPLIEKSRITKRIHWYNDFLLILIEIPGIRQAEQDKSTAFANSPLYKELTNRACSLPL